MKYIKNLFRDSVKKYTNNKITKQTIVKNIFITIVESESILLGTAKLKNTKFNNRNIRYRAELIALSQKNFD
jgi:hypothetical protein